MAYPLINPYQQFFDSSGAPLASGTIEFRDPNTNALINSYPTADDADAQTNANANPLTLSATGAAPTGLYLEDNVDYKVILKDADGNIVTTQDDVLCPTRPGTPQTALELANGITPTDVLFEPGNVFRYGAVADSANGVQGTDNTTAFQNAIDSGHAVYVPEGYYSIESTLQVFNRAITGLTGVHIQLSAGARLERFTNVATPILHVAGSNHRIEGNGATIAARTYGGFTKGLVLLGADPAAADNTGADSSVATTSNWISDLKIIGSTSVGTDWDGSVGMYCESARRRQGTFVTPLNISTYYNTISGVISTQVDYGFFLSTDCNANTFEGCTVLTFGHAAWYIIGYANQITNTKVEQGTAQDTTERYVVNFANKNTGPEAVHVQTDDESTEYTVTGVTKGATTVLTVSTDPTTTVAVGDKIKVTGIVDTGAETLNDALNGGHFEVLARDATTITISAVTTGLADWASGGIVSDSIYNIIGGRANQIHGFAEVGYNASTTVVRLVGCSLPLGTYSTSNIEGVYGRNIVRITGTHPGGIGPSGFSTAAALLNNTVDGTTVGLTDYGRPVRLHDWTATALDDATGSSYGGDNYRTFSGRMSSMAESTAYSVLTIDNVGPNEAGLLIKLNYVCKDDANSDVQAGEISWLCPTIAGNDQAAVKIKDFNGNSGTAVSITWSVANANGTTANTGKYTLTATTGNPAGTGVFYCAWKAEVISSEVSGTNLDWDADATITNGGL